MHNLLNAWQILCMIQVYAWLIYLRTLAIFAAIFFSRCTRTNWWVTYIHRVFIIYLLVIEIAAKIASVNMPLQWVKKLCLKCASNYSLLTDQWRSQGGRPPLQSRKNHSLKKSHSRKTMIYWRSLMCKTSLKRWYSKKNGFSLVFQLLLNGMYVILIPHSQKPPWL